MPARPPQALPASGHHGGRCSAVSDRAADDEGLAKAGFQITVAWVGPDAERVEGLGEKHRAAVDGSLGRLAERSLVTFNLDGQVVVAHRLVLRVVRDRLARQERLASVCRAAATVPDEQTKALVDSQDRLVVRDVPEQVAALREAVAGCASEPGAQLSGVLFSLRHRALQYLCMLGDSAQQAILIGEPLAADSERVRGLDHPDTLSTWNNLSIAYVAAGRVAEATALDERVLAARKRVLGPDHPDTLSSLHNLGNNHAVAGRVAEATALLEQAVDTRERVLGPDHPDTLQALSNLANVYANAGRVVEATALLERALGGRKQVLGPDHPDTLTAQHNLAVVYLIAGHTSKAIAMLKRALADRERVLGPDHPRTLGSLNNLASAYRKAGQISEAITLHEQALATQKRVLGPDHPNTLASLNNLGIAYGQWAV